ncbi:MAG: aminotransferase class I/II-fold pyridoxal phosphate-dependent enzyme [Bauldia sp.]|nr:aminotransferase class I/II-fold pyridoxal phosphate-dependent enzyme [Bauldia sp.]
MKRLQTAVGGPAASRRSAIRPFVAMDVLAAANRREATGARVVHMEVGQPSAPTPRAVIEAARDALAAGRFGYTEALGIPALRERVARHYHEAYGVRVDPRRVAITTGSSAAFNLALLAAFDAGDRVLVTAPGYPAYRNILGALDLAPVEVELSASAPVLTPERLREIHAAHDLSGVLIASPANPTGTMLTPTGLAALVAAAEELGIRYISDEIYHRLVYDGVAATAAGMSPHAIVVNSFSKYYCMTGWRIGWMVLPEDLVRPVERIAQNLYICPPDISQQAAIAAFDATEELDAVRDGYAASRALLLRRLPELGFTDLYPVDGAFYVYASLGGLGDDAEVFAARMLAEAGVAATPGIDFDPVAGSGSIRFSFAGSPADMAEAVQRMEAWLK